MTRNGGYDRYFEIERRLQLCWVYRKKCPRCLISFSLLPDDVLPLHSYGLELIRDRVLACLDGIPLRSRDFYVDKGLLPEDEESDAESWSDRLESEPLTPSHQLFQAWRVKFARRSDVWIKLLLVACIVAGCDLRSRLGKSLANFQRTPVDLHGFLLAAGLVGLLQGASVRGSLGQTLWILSGSNTTSHKILRALGRPPPQYGGDLELPRPQAQ